MDTNSFWAANLHVYLLRLIAVTKVMVDDLLFNIEYENISAICFSCGKIGGSLAFEN